MLANLLSSSGVDRMLAIELVHLWRLRNDWQQEKRSELLAAYVYATRKARAWNRLKRVPRKSQFFPRGS